MDNSAEYPQPYPQKPFKNAMSLLDYTNSHPTSFNPHRPLRRANSGPIIPTHADRLGMTDFVPRRNPEKLPLITGVGLAAESSGHGTFADQQRHHKKHKRHKSTHSSGGGVIEGIRSFILSNTSSDASEDEESSSDSFHCHDDRKQAAVDYKARRTLVMASIICLLFMVAEIIGGLMASSLAIMTDAAHLLTDFASFLISLFSLYMASRPASKRMHFGWHRAEVLGAFVSVLLIWVVTGVLVYIAIQRIINGKYEIDAEIMLITAGIGVTVNIIMGLLLHFGGGHGHSHGGGGHGHSHSATTSSHESLVSSSHLGEHGDSHKSRNINVRAALIHVIGDFVQSVGVMLAAALIYLKPEWAIADPICTFIFSILVLITTMAIMRDAVTVLMEGKPRGIDFGEVIESLQGIDGVLKVHDLRIWSLTMDKVALSVHLAVAPTFNTQTLLKTATAMLRKKYGVHECTVQIEGYSDSMLECGQCEHPQ